MTVEEAIKTSIEYEIRVRDVYVEAVREAQRPEGEKLFQLMADEEQRHVDYLKVKLDEWNSDGTVTSGGLTTAVPSGKVIEEGVGKLREKVGGKPGTVEIQWLRKAHGVERETSDFYKRMVDELPDAAKGLFRRFLEIEEGHLALVQAQIDYVTGTGYWFDVREFNLEG
ncbi:MAG: ferritin family protein [Candidatus Eisenbacteria bacterium]|nr:ferritin family protein [Candidatus Eisenbacteria bacterium]